METRIDQIDKSSATKIVKRLLKAPVAPGVYYSKFINAGTNFILDILEEEYFVDTLQDGISCFKYLQGYYGSGKTQFINSLAARAWDNDIVTSISSIGQDCPFNSPASIYKSIMANIIPPPELGRDPTEERGIELLIDTWIRRKLRKLGISEGQSVPPQAREQIEKPFKSVAMGARDVQALYGIQALGKALVELQCGGGLTTESREIIAWIRGEKIRSRNLRENNALTEPVFDANAFARLMTIFSFLRKRMGFKGFFIAFDEGTETASFRRGSVKQKQAIQNMLTMINKDEEDEFAGVMFLYSATPDFRNDVIEKYAALNDRIGDASFSAGSPMVPFIDLDALDTDEIIREMGKKILSLFAIYSEMDWDTDAQEKNIELLTRAEKEQYGLGSEIRRAFTYHFCMLLNSFVKAKQTDKVLSDEEAMDLVNNTSLPTREN